MSFLGVEDSCLTDCGPLEVLGTAEKKNIISHAKKPTRTSLLLFDHKRLLFDHKRLSIAN